MSIELFVVDAFTDKPFAGNPAAVCLLADSMSEPWMQQVAAEMNLAETAFLSRRSDGFELRWFTPLIEVDLCGHATLASAFMLWTTGVLSEEQEAKFLTRSGWLTCRRMADKSIEMNFPATPTTDIETFDRIESIVRRKPVNVSTNKMDLMVELDSESDVRSVVPDLRMLKELPYRGLIVTSKSDDPTFDFVSRFFAPAAGIDEDPVTGSAHCSLAPYWAQRLGKSIMVGFQASRRGGVVGVEILGDRVLLRGQAVMISRVQLIAGCD